MKFKVLLEKQRGVLLKSWQFRDEAKALQFFREFEIPGPFRLSLWRYREAVDLVFGNTLPGSWSEVEERWGVEEFP